MTTTFSILAGVMLLAALAFLLFPLLRRRGHDDSLRSKRLALEQARRAGVLSEEEVSRKLAVLASSELSAPAPSRVLPAVLALLIPLAAIGLYRQIGEPRALDPVWQGAVAAATGATNSADDGAAAQGPDMEKAVAGLAERLRLEPNDLEGWTLLGRAYKSMERFDPAREALANAYRLAPENPDVLVEYAEALVLASDSRRFQGESRTLLERAVALQPENQRGLWLLGIAAYQDQDYREATAIWEKLLAAIPADADARASLIERIADARQRAGLEPAVASRNVLPPGAAETATTQPESSPQTSAGDAGTTPQLTVIVDLAPELKSKVGASDVLFVFARAAVGPRMPLAIQRLPAASLPVTVTLDDSTSMMPSMKLSTMPQVVVGARISKSGQAAPQSGDFETLSAPIANTHREPLHLIIDKVVP